MKTIPALFVLLLAGGVVVAASAAAPPAAMPLPQVWTGNIVAPPDNQRLGIRDIEVKVMQMSTDHELGELRGALSLGGQQGLREAMFRLEQKAWVRIGRMTATSVGVVRVVDLPDGRRRLRLVSDHPARLFDNSEAPGSYEHPFAFVELIVDRNGNGEGQMIAAASINFTDEGLAVETASTPVIKIQDVTSDSPPR